MNGRIYNSMIDLIGNTPMVRLNKMSMETGAEVIAKIEYFNPMSSIKDRIAFAMVEDAVGKGLIKSDTVLVEPTSGNTGIGLAFVCAIKGIKLILVMPETMSIERRKLLKFMGAELVLTPGEKGMKGAVEKASALVNENKNYLMLQQFENRSNPEFHRKTTAEEIIRDCGGKVDFFVAGIGTGGTITGVGSVLKEKIKGVKIIGVEPDESPVISGGNPASHKIQGIGAGFIPVVLDVSVIDEIIRVKSEDAFLESRRAALEEGILSGISSGAALKGARILALRPENKGKRIIAVIPDTAERYLSTTLFE